ncbi:MAG: hypothetical protein KAS17_00525 [Victivallaceae bacterium]|nr:hypothetical protein [Victivallaceae bacterium]
MGTICPYCNIEVDEARIEFEDGCCPECGSVITVSTLDDDDGPAVFEEDEDFFDNIEFDDEDSGY